MIEKLSVSDRYANEEVKSSYTYPSEYRGPKLISEQVDILADIFKLSLGLTSEFIEKVLPTLTLPDGAEGWFAIPSVDAVAIRFFSEVTDPAERYCRAVQLVLQKIGESRKFYNYCEGQLGPDRLRQHARTVHMLDLITEKQQGDILIIPAQFGKRHAGRSDRRAREVFLDNEFGLGAFAGGCLLITNPDRLQSNRDLWIDCPGDEYHYPIDEYFLVAGGQFSRAPCFDFGYGVKFGASWFGDADENCGSVSAFLIP